MENLEPYLDKFSEGGRRILEFSLDDVRRRGQNAISPEHILYAVIINEPELFAREMSGLSTDVEAVRSEVERRLVHSYRHSGQGFRIAPATTEIFKYSMDRARSRGRRVIEPGDIIYALVTDRASLLNEILRDADSDPDSHI